MRNTKSCVNSLAPNSVRENTAIDSLLTREGSEA